MNLSNLIKPKQFQDYFYLVILIIIILGIFFRFYNLDKKVYWHDEVYTSLHLTGYTLPEWQDPLFTGNIIGVDDLQYYLQSNPNKTLNDTLKVLAVDDPHHPPLYYILARYWRQFWGDSINIIRSFSAVCSLLVFPAIYWLAWELFGTSLVGIMSLGLIAISPFFILYAQEAREYSLWTVFVILSNSSLLRAIKLTQKNPNLQNNFYPFWGLYALLTTFSLYTSLVTIFVIIAQTTYTLLTEGLRFTKSVILQGLSVLASLIAFLPWILVFIDNYEQYKLITSWTKEIKLPFFELFKNWGLNLSRIFFDINWNLDNLLIYLVVFLSLVLVIYSLYFLCQNTTKQAWGLIFALIVTPFIFLFIPDLLWGGVRSLSPRYLIPSIIAIYLAVAYLLVNQLTQKNSNKIRIWSIITAIIFSSGVISSAISSQADTWWTKVISSGFPQVSRIINSSDNPLLISNDKSYHPGNIMSLSYLLKSEVKLQLLSEEKGYKIPNNFSNIFLLSPSDEFRKNLENQSSVKLKKVFSDSHLQLWKI
ncbi:conserved hypothetical protein [Rippkaea orientalis PCC 8801]|uniref:Glycosyltransferase RgtA/B/C/D-like domain-containing protein n=1 Tax=Rippkaea orientalis (strain PCC 8801 / RF-1) TaxID=41431 RepID=B7K5Z7_RIPO1|nr:glycosyltransferase family 39 protein [Rippkaea orientalis]ACK68050.1 conserved hypothetical protein [Rippkaea orientalis PCC 8801]